MPHLLKGLELNGFKSFAQKTTLDLSHGITAVVGPNGSGKSNVIDSIRWLLGEREAKNLRGGKGEDLIYAGGAKKARLGQASASLYFDNSNKFFPVDFPEIVVTRQVNRDGSNQYFINKSEVRLKDLIDFFAQARLGARGFVVVTQGNSDMFIQASPLTRREMIEEMLGLREYQLKKTEAERRLKNTQINLDKVKALTEEILPHLRSLKRQTNRWEKRDALDLELKQLENQFFGTEWRTLRVQFMDIDADLERHKAARTGLEESKLKAEEQLKLVEASQPEGRKQLGIVKAQTQGLLDRKSALQKDLGRLEVQVEHAAKSPQAAASSGSVDLVALVKKIKLKLELALDSEDPSKAINEILEEIDGALQGGSDKGSAPAPAVEIAPELAHQLSELKRDLAALENDIGGLKEKEHALEHEQEQFYSQFKAAVAAVESAKDRLERWETENRDKQFARERLEIRRTEWERQIHQAGRSPEDFANLGEIQVSEDRDALERRILRLRGELASIGEVDEALVREARETENRYEFLTREHADLEKAKEDLRALIQEMNEKIRTEFTSALHKINAEFEKFFSLMFGGGQAKLKLQEIKKKEKRKEEDMVEEPEIKDEVKAEEEEEPEQGIEVSVNLPRKRITSLDMLSGGERSLVGIAALFALVSVSPPPFLVLDEVDAPLDERNARRFSEMLKEFSKETQFVLVTHNRVTMEAADILYGVTMDSDGVSKVVSLRLDDEARSPAPSHLA